MSTPNLPNRRSIRLKNYDYSAAGLYFITLCTTDRLHLFGQIMNGEMHYNTFGTIATEEWAKTPEIRKNISLGEFIIMPNHFHAIISIDYKITSNDNEQIGKFQSPSQTIGAIIRGYKGATTKRINQIIR
nr:transposase [uncultured Draconibacterium sp.]